MCTLLSLLAVEFQSTPSVGRATEHGGVMQHKEFISIHALRGEGDLLEGLWNGIQNISIHALRGEGDEKRCPSLRKSSRFQSTPSVGRATQKYFSSRYRSRDFNPRPPWGGRLAVQTAHNTIAPFQSTPSVGRATGGFDVTGFEIKDFNPRPPWGGRHAHLHKTTYCFKISIHALRGEGDNGNGPHRPPAIYFNPRPPWGGRRPVALRRENISAFQSTPSVGRATTVEFRDMGRGRDFNPRPPWGGRLTDEKKSLADCVFQSTPSVGRATR